MPAPAAKWMTRRSSNAFNRPSTVRLLGLWLLLAAPRRMKSEGLTAVFCVTVLVPSVQVG